MDLQYVREMAGLNEYIDPLHRGISVYQSPNGGWIYEVRTKDEVNAVGWKPTEQAAYEEARKSTRTVMHPLSDLGWPVPAKQSRTSRQDRQ